MSEPNSARTPTRTWLVVTGAAIVLAAIYLGFAPHTADLAAQTARAELYRRSGFVAYWSRWYSGIPTASYSLVTPPLLGWFGPRWLGALCVVATGLIAVPLLRDARRPAVGALAVLAAAMLDVVSGRTTFAVGVVFALAAVLAAERRRPLLAGLAALVATAASPVAGVLLAVVAIGTVLAGPRRRWASLNLLAGVGVGLVVLAVLSRGAPAGYEPLTRTTLLISLLTTAVVIVSPVGRRVRTTAWLAGLLLLLCFWVHSPIGANATRLAVLGAAPAVIAAARWPKILLLLAVVAAGFTPISQLHNDLANAGGPTTEASYVAPLKAELVSQQSVTNHRVEVVDSNSHWLSTYLVPAVSLARGWERQIDESANPIFYGRAPLDSVSYRAFLDRNAVGYVAVPRAPKLDFGSRAEAGLISTGLSYLRPIWSDSNWQLYAVTDPTPIAALPCTVVAQSNTGLTVTGPSGATCTVDLNWSPALRSSGAAVTRGPGGFLRLRLSGGGPHRIHAEWRWP